jgi:Polyketide cyclase / dehydrase and lipid transport
VKELDGVASAPVRASVQECVELFRAVDRYPDWYGEVVRDVAVLERDAEELPSRARATLHVSAGPLVRDLQLVLAITATAPARVRLARIPHEPSDAERFEVVWSVVEGPPTQVRLELSATLSVPRLVPLGGIGDAMARGFAAAAARQLGPG